MAREKLVGIQGGKGKVTLHCTNGVTLDLSSANDLARVFSMTGSALKEKNTKLAREILAVMAIQVKNALH